MSALQRAAATRMELRRGKTPGWGGGVEEAVSDCIKVMGRGRRRACLALSVQLWAASQQMLETRGTGLVVHRKKSI